MHMERNNFRIVLDTTPIETKLAYLNLIIREKGSIYYLPDSVASRLTRDVVLTGASFETASDGIMELKQTVDLGQTFNELVTGLLNPKRS